MHFNNRDVGNVWVPIDTNRYGTYAMARPGTIPTLWNNWPTTPQGRPQIQASRFYMPALAAPGQVDLAAVIAGIGALVASLTVTRALQVAIAGTGTLAPRLSKSFSLSVSIAGTGALSANLTKVKNLAVSIAGAGQLVAALREQVALQMAATGQGVLSATLDVVSGGGGADDHERTKRGSGQ